MRALVAFPFGSRVGGAEQVLHDVLLRRGEHGLDVEVVLLEDGPVREEWRALGVRVDVLDPGRFREPHRHAAAVARLARRLRASRPDVLVAWTQRPHTVLAPAALLAGQRRRLVLAEHLIPDAGGLARVVYALPCAHVIANSAATLAAVRERRPGVPATMVAPGIAAPAAAGDAALAALRAELGLGDRPVATIVGRLLGWKGQERLVAAVALLRDRGVDLDLLVVGDESHGVEPGGRARLEAAVARHGVGDRVRLLGHRAPSAPYLEVADVVVSASVGEPWGLVLLEGMALRRPVLAVDDAGPREVLDGGAAGLLVSSGEPADLAGGLARLLADPGLRERLAAAGHARWAARFTADAMTAQYVRALRAVAAAA